MEWATGGSPATLWTRGGGTTRGGEERGGTGRVRGRWRRLAAASAAAETRGTAAAGVAGAGEDDDFGEGLRAAQVMKSLGEKSRSKRATRGIQGRVSSALAHAG